MKHKAMSMCGKEKNSICLLITQTWVLMALYCFTLLGYFYEQFNSPCLDNNKGFQMILAGSYT